MTIKKYILLSISTLVIAGCTSEDISNVPSDERIPLRLEATLSSGSAVTRAYDNTFEKNDELLSYVQHVYKDGNTYTEASGIQASLVTFTKGSAAMETVENVKTTMKTSDLKPEKALYWDDFSNSSSEETDLRTAEHGLRSYYGYCYNGGIPSTKLDDITGVLGWTTDDDQSADGDMKKNDLLWSATQAPVTYEHEKQSREGLTIPFTHAMSKFTIVLVAGDGFEAGDLKNTTVTLKDMKKVGTFTAPTGEVSATDDVTDVKMYSSATDAETATTRTYEAVTVPLTELSEGKLIAQITNADGNNYEIKITKSILGTSNPVAEKNWKEGINDGKTQSGVNYKLTVTLKKQTVSVVATLADWNGVDATGIGEIQFTADVTDCGVSNSLNANDKFTLWRAVKSTGELTDDTFTTSSTATFDGTNFTYSPVLYWPNKDDSYYFRALAIMSGSSISAVSKNTVNQDEDMLWATTPAHSTYDIGDAIAPRTGAVPLAFEHAMSKVVITLSTKADNTDPAYVDLSKATFKLKYLSTSGTIALVDGSITPADAEEVVFSDGISGVARIMVPQTIGNDAKLIINLNDNTSDPDKSTTYSLQLNTCIDSSKAIIKTWESGKQYKYTIGITKEEMKFLVQIKDWTTSNGCGNATLDWD